jgi:hypothetical protein
MVGFRYFLFQPAPSLIHRAPQGCRHLSPWRSQAERPKPYTRAGPRRGTQGHPRMYAALRELVSWRLGGAMQDGRCPMPRPACLHLFVISSTSTTTYSCKSMDARSDSGKQPPGQRPYVLFVYSLLYTAIGLLLIPFHFPHTIVKLLILFPTSHLPGLN